MKKIKNPEKYIERLKAEIERLTNQVQIRQLQADRLSGKPVIFWDENTTDTQNVVNSRNFGIFKLNDEVVVLGKIIKVEEFYDSNNKPASSITFRRTRTIIRPQGL